ncbi:hypothetical protein K1719_010401 [Acacia pycnantha]|nr:hypothetical protein K1719_010401 [Acacia pycnantha]
MDSDSEKVEHTGGCHCKSVRWKAVASPNVVAWDCNCSYCYMRANKLFVVPAKRFELLGDSDRFVTTYSFGTHTAKHTFCKVCGIISFYHPRSNPDGVAVAYKCVDPGTLKSVEIKHIDGRNWEESVSRSGISAYSKVQKISELMLIRKVPVLKEIEEINGSVAKLLAFSDAEKLDASMELQKQLHVLEKLMDDVSQEMDESTKTPAWGWVAVSCTSVDPGTLKSVEIERFDGGNWKKSYHRIGNASNSKEKK